MYEIGSEFNLEKVSDHRNLLEDLTEAAEDAERYIGRKADKNRKIYNGMIKSYYYQFMGKKPPVKK